jgi:hypothetical protein
LEINNPSGWSLTDTFNAEMQRFTSNQTYRTLSLSNSASNNNIIPLPRHKKKTAFDLSRSSSNLSSTSASSGNKFFFKDPSNSSKILEGLNKLRTSKSMCDITLKVEDAEFFCHKCVLSSLSNYFSAMFSFETERRLIVIKEIDSTTMSSIIDYAYTSNLLINDQNVQNLLSASNLFDISSIKDAW